MKTNSKIFLALTLVTLILTVSAVNAADSENPVDTISDATTVSDTSIDSISTEQMQTATDNEKVADAKNKEKEYKDIKKDSITIDGNTYSDIYENEEINGEDTYLGKNTYFNNCTFVGEWFAIFGIKSYANNTVSNALLCVDQDVVCYFNNSFLNEGIEGGWGTSTIYLYNSTLNKQIYGSRGLVYLYLDDNSIIDPEITITNIDKIKFITNNTNIIYPYTSTFNAENGKLKDITIDKNITNLGNLTLDNVTANSTITNKGVLTVKDNVVFRENFFYNGDGEIIINDTSKIAPYLSSYNGNYTLTNVTINDDKKNYGNLTIIDSTINAKILNTIEGRLTLINTTINGEIVNYGVIAINNSSNTDNIQNYGEILEGSIPEDHVYVPTSYIVNKDTIDFYFKETDGYKLNSLVKEGDTLDFQGEIKLNGISLIVNRAVNIITTTNDTYIDLNTTAGNLFGENPGSSFVINYDGSNTNVTGIYFHNTQLWLYNTHNVTLDNISGVVESRRIGSGVGQTTIRANSTNITVKNSYFYTKDNGGSSTLVFAWADNSTIENCTVVGEGNVGNLIYLTTYNVNIPSGVNPNSNNRIINNTITGPAKAAGICWGIVLGGVNNLVDGNTIYYSGTGITGQWGSGVTGDYNDEQSLIDIYGNTVCNNQLYNGSNINAGNIIYNNYVEKGAITANNARVYNNTANGLTIGDNAIVTNNTITGTTTVNSDKRTNALIENNTLGNIQINGNNTQFNNNNITGKINTTKYSSNHTFTNNNITSDITIAEYAVNFKFNDNNITGEITLVGNNAIWTNNDITGNIIIGYMMRGGNKNQIHYNNITGKISFESWSESNNNTLTNNNITGYIEYNVTNNRAGSNNTFANNSIISPEQYTFINTGIQDIQNNTITDNYLKAEGTYADDSVNINKELNTVANNTPVNEVHVEDITATIGETTTITAAIYFDGEEVTDINTGKVCFRVNGKVLRDENNKVIYTDITDGKATIENIDTTKWSEDTTIQAVVTGNENIPQSISEIMTPTITYPEQDEPEFSVADATATAGSEVTITVTMKNLGAGKVVLKVNGKTVKTADGKLYAKTEGDSVTFTYTVPKTYKAGEYDIKAVYTSGTTKLEAESKLMVE